jgi:hypothetical protein
MKRCVILFAVLVCAYGAVGPAAVNAADCVGRPCLPDRPIPPESLGSIGLPFDVPIWPTLLKTEFQILPWVNFGKASVCLPYSGKSIDLPVPLFSLKPIPVWIPWLRPLDIEMNHGASSVCR